MCIDHFDPVESERCMAPPETVSATPPPDASIFYHNNRHGAEISAAIINTTTAIKIEYDYSNVVNCVRQRLIVLLCVVETALHISCKTRQNDVPA